MISLLELTGREKVLEVGTGSGYDAAVLSRLAAEVLTIEIDPGLASRAKETLRALGYRNVRVRVGDGYRGWPEEAPFDAIVLTTAPDRIPEPLFDQLKEGGRLVVAVGDFVQDLQVITKTEGGGRRVKKVSLVRLGPMSGEVARGGG
jgi:protein-L-isoaspartate(D-aspartate) O-methyltransferase